MIHEQGRDVNMPIRTKTTSPRRGGFRAHNYPITDNYENSCAKNCNVTKILDKRDPVDNSRQGEAFLNL